MKTIYFCFMVLIFACGAESQETSSRQKAIEINNKAAKLYKESWGDPKIAENVLRLYDKAIKTDSLYWMAYLNKVQLLCELGRRKAALRTLNMLANVQPSDYIGYLSASGFILERMGRTSEAKKRYLQEIAQYDTAIKRSPDSLTVQMKISRAFLLFFIKGQSATIQEYEKIASEYPGNDFVKSQRVSFYYFDRQKFIKDYCK